MDADGYEHTTGIVHTFLDRYLGTDEKVAAELQKFIASGKDSLDMIGEAFNSNERMQQILAHYPKTLRVLRANKAWLMKDLPGMLDYLVTCSDAARS